MYAYLSNVNIMQRINALARLLNVLGYGIWKKFVNHILQVRRDNVGGDQLDHLLTDGADL
jgi:hypothetical protein